MLLRLFSQKFKETFTPVYTLLLAYSRFMGYYPFDRVARDPSTVAARKAVEIETAPPRQQKGDTMPKAEEALCLSAVLTLPRRT